MLLKQCLSETKSVLDKQSALLLKDLNKRHLYPKIGYTSYFGLVNNFKTNEGSHYYPPQGMRFFLHSNICKENSLTAKIHTFIGTTATCSA